ncbi:MAG: lipase [Candidatus Altiarchaeota archaeon]|nr:lipase [Candidatus Altiarchaeota archaeon]
MEKCGFIMLMLLFVVSMVVCVNNYSTVKATTVSRPTTTLNINPRISVGENSMLQSSDKPVEVVFLGDSITAGGDWNGLFGVSYIKNAGVDGDTTDDILSRLNSVTRYKPKKIFLMMGINDLLLGKNVSHVLANYETALGKIKTESPDTTVYLQSVLPVHIGVPGRQNVIDLRVIALNNKLKSLADGDKTFFIDLYPSFCRSDSKLYKNYSADGLHLNSGGYAVWKNLTAQYII